MAINPMEEVQKYIGGISFPSHKDNIMQNAQQKGAGQNVLETLRKLPDREYHSAGDVTKEVGNSLKNPMRKIM